MNKKPTRKDLLKVLGRIQDLAGRAKGIYLIDTGTDRADKLLPMLQEIFDLCVC